MFVQDYGKIAKSLTQLFKKDGFHYNMDAQRASVSRLPTLAIPDFSKPFVVETDASSKGLGAVFLQEGRPLAFWSQAFSDRAQNKLVYEKELMAAIQALHKWRHYLLGAHFVIITDQKSLKFLTERKLLKEEQFRWASKSIGSDFEIR